MEVASSLSRWVMVFHEYFLNKKTSLLLPLLSLGLSAKQRSPLLLRTAKVCLLKLCNFLIIDRKRSTPMAFFTDEVKPRSLTNEAPNAASRP